MCYFKVWLHVGYNKLEKSFRADRKRKCMREDDDKEELED